MKETAVMKRTGFTLVELLVVVAIIAVLIAILLPSLSGARDQSKGLRCKANLKAIAMAMLAYSDEDGQMIPGYAGDRSVNGGANSQYYTNLLVVNGFLGDSKWTGSGWGSIKTGIWLCPMEPNVNVSGSLGGGYAVNWQMNVVTISSTGAEVMRPKIASITATSERWLIGDAKIAYSPTWMEVPCNYILTPELNPGNQEKPSNRHKGKTNVGYVDGHAETIDWMKMAGYPTGGVLTGQDTVVGRMMYLPNYR